MSCVQHQYRNIPDLHGLISMPRQAWKLTPRDLRISTRHALVPKSLDMKNDRHIQDGVRTTLSSPSPLFTILRPYWSTYNYVTWKNASRVIRIKFETPMGSTYVYPGTQGKTPTVVCGSPVGHAENFVEIRFRVLQQQRMLDI
ncbi:hypothetical protein KL906_004613 [Ogataea polymorpha]|nr:hypothetical protein KL906_004613 [Ogataea polymorpha]KAG7914096.1 hypothetical protein KL927_004747 [Ogataea polymorpha]KAG7930543.1 hypothetical protein KL934_004616 [Ogataea polymorpha]